MPNEISRLPISTGASMSPAAARALRRQQEHLAVEARVAYDRDTAAEFLTRVAIQRTVDLRREVIEATAEDPAGGRFYDALFQAYFRGARDRLDGFRL